VSRSGPDEHPEDQETPTMPPPRPTPARSAQARSAQVPAPRTDRTGDELRGLLEPVVTAAGFELDTLDVRSAGRRHTVRLVVDSDAGVGLDDIARISRAASDELDGNEHLVGGSYTLEVTSPGVDRPLTSPRHWRRARLRLVAVRPQAGDPFEGRVGDAGDDAVTLLVGGALREVRYADVAHAAVEVEFAPPPEKDLALLDPGHLVGPGPGAAAQRAHDEAAEDPE
jgi:ribosome maturation factor RimP